jgi:2-keto-4-pentenoate hydratase/2-oxohepta-3-ene-1,7-dioic acid hydratase in catechol pathway
MKLATFDAGDGARLGVVVEGGIVDLATVNPRLPTTMMALIAAWDDVKGDVAEAAKVAAHHALDKVTLLAPVPRPGKAMAIGLNYADHIAESGQETPKNQIWFAKVPTSINPPYADIEMPKTTNFVDYEAEMVAIIGKGGRNISKHDAAAAVFGYCVGNDVTARDWQFKSPQWSVGKSFDTHGPIGPWIVTSDEVGDPHALEIRGLVNGEVRQHSNTRNLVFNVFDQLAELSQAMTLEPGDVIFTGTPGGVGIAMKPPVKLNDGDVVRIEIEKLGHIEATMKAG